MFRLFLKKWIFLLLILIFSFIIHLRTQVVFFYFIFWFLLGAVILNLLVLFLEYLFFNLSFSRELSERVTEDDYLEIKLIIRNNSILPFFNFIISDFLACAPDEEKKFVNWFDYLGPKSIRILNYRCLCYKRGKYLIGPLTLYLFDPFNLFYLEKFFPLYSELYVYPRTFKIEKFPNLLKGIQPWFGIDTARVSGDEDEFFGIREYIMGDPIKRIHWWSTARKSTLIVREFQRQSFYRATILFNLEEDKNFGSGKHTVCEYAIKIAASVAKYLIERNVSLEIIAHVGEIVHIPFNKGNEHLDQILKFLTIAEAKSKVSLKEFFLEHASYISDNSNLIVIMTEDDWQYLPILFSLKTRNISLIPLVIISETFLYPEQKEKITLKAKLELSRILELQGKFFAYLDNLEEAFSY